MAGSLGAMRVLIADENAFTRSIVADILRAQGFGAMYFAQDGEQLLQQTVHHAPRIVITSSRLPLGGVSGLEFTRMVRAGHGQIDRALSIIVTTNTASVAFLEAARAAGVDEMLVRPFTAQSLLARVEAVLIRPRQFIDSAAYVGPCRRRRMLQDYDGPYRRLSDPIEEAKEPAWEHDANRELMRLNVLRLAALVGMVAPGDRRSIQALHLAAEQTKQLAREVRDEMMEAAVRSLLRYIAAFGAAQGLDCEVLSTHADAMQKLCSIGSCNRIERACLVSGLDRVVDKRLGRGSPQQPLLAAG
ncbi:MAG: response regulator [Hyphomonadaceae bacterium]